ncbi:O-antigen ligase family protein [Hydrogenoanaerobacterium sp.]|uniref:O-antigen ligase family protein n=1 Tax=Hydrogenoanaerobacterium sp. TaxID=2953763 RepID=UPI00289BFF0B|nr:O-antigen ligase family protein [Hydrogenoanaerobacterium sp.]
MPQFLRDRESLFGFVLQCTLAVMLFELAATYSFYIFDILLIVLAALFMLVLIDRGRLDAAGFLRDVTGRFGGFWLVPVFLLLYLVCDLLGIAYSAMPQLGIEKYKVVVLMLFLSGCVLVYVDSIQKLRSILWSLGLAAGVTALFTLVNYLLLHIFPIPYTLRLTLRRDYNVFATTLLLGFLCMFYLFITAERTPLVCILFTLDIAVTLIVLYLSASRRVFLMLPLILAFWLCVFLLRQRSWQGLLAMMAVTVAAGALFWFGTMAMQGYMQKQYNQYGSYGPSGSGGSGEGSAADRYETVSEGNLLTKRQLIWGIAWNEFQSYTFTEKLIGKGFAYDIALYDEVENEQLAKEYEHLEGKKGLLSAHNFVLADLLNGGFIKAALGILLVGSLIWACVVLAFQSFTAAVLYGNALAVVVLNSLVSNRYGLLYDKFFYLFALLMLLHLRYQRIQRKGLFNG